ncbi:putative bifunctional diguanylate cyclase/phosphodiesterase [Mongoliimonas terrestris]|uniref:putative bifunctional diguanylate cyclase/phosphodiesterase n=1 Tax=Mongoliimonas terrestris TaxID=1709001 RepID=UPI0009495594|nr:bifunctional diguanylate cyclase/phosphodiesterase [Mongoliimonas terrestris]
MVRSSRTDRLFLYLGLIFSLALAAGPAIISWNDLSEVEEDLPAYGFYKIRGLRYAYAEVVTVGTVLDALVAGAAGPDGMAILRRAANDLHNRFEVFQVHASPTRTDAFVALQGLAGDVQARLTGLLEGGRPVRRDTIQPIIEANDRLLDALSAYVLEIEVGTDRAINRQQAEMGKLKVKVVVSIAILSVLAMGVLVLLVSHRRHHAQMATALNQDVLTGLPNRRAFTNWMDEPVERGRHVLAVIDLDDFKTVNDRYGHAAGDRLLKAVSAWLRAELPAGAKAARWGGDEFVAAWPCGDKTRAEILQCMAAANAHPIRVTVDQDDIDGQLSGGLAIWPDDGPTLADVLLKADLALYEGKDLGKRRIVMFEPAIKTRRDAVDRTRAGLRRALADEQMHLLWQPQVDLVTGRMVGAEGLIRWTNPDTGEAMQPGEFIAIAERSDLIVEIDCMVLETACRTIAKWLETGASPPRLSVNISARHFQRSTLARTVADVLNRHKIPSGFLELEITEGVFLADNAAVRANLADFAAMGIRLALDDFGTGYSNIAYMTRMRPAMLKIDRSFLRETDAAARSKIIGSMLRLAHSIGVETLVEGVETEADLAFLKDLGCRFVQGFLFARPMPAEDLLPWRDAFERPVRAVREPMLPDARRIGARSSAKI